MPAYTESLGSTYQSIGSTGSHYSEIPASPFEHLELLLEKVKIQFNICFAGVLFTILGYLAIWSMSRCCELPFQESSCTARNIVPLPSTNYSTLGEEVDKFVSASWSKIPDLYDVIDMPSLADRQRTFGIIDYDLWELIQDHSANLAAFGAIKREDERREELEEAVGDGYAILLLFGFIVLLFYAVIAACLNGKSGSPKWSHFDGLEKLSAEESDNFRNARQKKIKRQIPMFYMATWTCFMVQLGLYAGFFKSQYYTGHCPIFYDIEQSTLDLHLVELNKTMQSPNLEVRQLGWKYEYNAIEAAFRHHTQLKQYNVDRNVMPRKINYAPRNIIFLILCFMCNILVIGFWAMQEGSVWLPWQFIKIYF
ncbi:hypothetical protein DdX_11277 [Ditylenchus destructor]|uniref:Uncharacterized protein n=1 Tax=Ditylenchus destructor TaxID=166010 RepID=A0AAD4QYD6_9BILA|nr:hypothetical protein DdX_11277 [Ditylenchus destructor]